MKTAMKIVTTAVLAVALTTPVQALAQFGGLKGMVPSLPAIPGLPGSGAASSVSAVDPDTFLAEAFETTKYMMVAAAILADAAGVAQDQAGLAARVKSIQESQDIKEIDAYKTSFAQDLDALNANDQAADLIQANYERGSAEQKRRIAAAAYNFALGAYRDVKLAQQAPELLQGVKTNPKLLMKAGSLKLAADLVVMQAKGTASMAGSITRIMTASKIAAPQQSESTRPLPIEFS